MRVIVFFTFDMSLESWKDNGTIERELLLYKHMVKKGYDITMWTYGSETDLRYTHYLDGIKVVPVYANTRWSANRYVRLMKSLFLPFRYRELLIQADIYKTNQMYGAWVPVIAKVIFRKKLIIRCGYEYLHDALANSSNALSSIIRFIPRYLLEFVAYKLADAIVITSDFSRQYIKRMFWISDTRIRIQRNYVDTHVFKPGRGRSKARWGAAIVFIGRLHPAKNIFALLEAIKGTRFRLSIIGRGPQERQLKDYASKTKIKATFLSSFPHGELPRILRSHGIFVLPSLYENNPKVLIEAMACGLPVVGSDIDGIREVVKHEYNGLLCNPDPISIRRVIDTLGQNPELRHRLGGNARRTIEQSFSIGSIALQESLLYEKLKTRAM